MQYECRLSEFCWEFIVLWYVEYLTRNNENNSIPVLYSIYNTISFANSGFVSSINELQEHRNNLVYITWSALRCGTCQCEPDAYSAAVYSAHYAWLSWTAPPRALDSSMCGRHDTGPQTRTVFVRSNWQCTVRASRRVSRKGILTEALTGDRRKLHMLWRVLRNMSFPSSGSTNKPSKKPVVDFTDALQCSQWLL